MDVVKHPNLGPIRIPEKKNVFLKYQSICQKNVFHLVPQSDKEVLDNILLSLLLPHPNVS